MENTLIVFLVSMKAKYRILVTLLLLRVFEMFKRTEKWDTSGASGQTFLRLVHRTSSIELQDHTQKRNHHDHEGWV